MMQSRYSKADLVIITPVFNDWRSLSALVKQLSVIVSPLSALTHLVIVDDGGTDPVPDLPVLLAGTNFRATLVTLERNVGSQRAIAMGLCHAVEALDPERIIIMDADGEDRPEDVPALLAALAANPGAIVVAERGRRSEGLRFRLFYRLYKGLFALLTGFPISFGNFSALHGKAARRLVHMHELLLHVPASLIRSRYPLVHVQTDRGLRFAGHSNMNTLSLIMHGMSAIAVFSERIFTRVLVFCAAIFACTFVAALVAIVLKAAGLATPGWTTSVAGLMIMIVMQVAAVAMGGLFIVMNNKHDLALLPMRVARDLVNAACLVDKVGAGHADDDASSGDAA